MTEQKIRIKYTPNKQISADGFTKALPKDRWPEFLQLLKLINIKTQLKTRRQAKLETLKDRFAILKI